MSSSYESGEETKVCDQTMVFLSTATATPLRDGWYEWRDDQPFLTARRSDERIRANLVFLSSLGNWYYSVNDNNRFFEITEEDHFTPNEPPTVQSAVTEIALRQSVEPPRGAYSLVFDKPAIDYTDKTNYNSQPTEDEASRASDAYDVYRMAVVKPDGQNPITGYVYPRLGQGEEVEQVSIPRPINKRVTIYTPAEQSAFRPNYFQNPQADHTAVPTGPTKRNAFKSGTGVGNDGFFYATYSYVVVLSNTEGGLDQSKAALPSSGTLGEEMKKEIYNSGGAIYTPAPVDTSDLEPPKIPGVLDGFDNSLPKEGENPKGYMAPNLADANNFDLNRTAGFYHYMPSRVALFDSNVDTNSIYDGGDGQEDGNLVRISYQVQNVEQLDKWTNYPGMKNYTYYATREHDVGFSGVSFFDLNSSIKQRYENNEDTAVNTQPHPADNRAKATNNVAANGLFQACIMQPVFNDIQAKEGSSKLRCAVAYGGVQNDGSGKPNWLEFKSKDLENATVFTVQLTAQFQNPNDGRDNHTTKLERRWQHNFTSYNFPRINRELTKPDWPYSRVMSSNVSMANENQSDDPDDKQPDTVTLTADSGPDVDEPNLYVTGPPNTKSVRLGVSSDNSDYPVSDNKLTNSTASSKTLTLYGQLDLTVHPPFSAYVWSTNTEGVTAVLSRDVTKLKDEANLDQANLFPGTIARRNPIAINATSTSTFQFDDEFLFINPEQKTFKVSLHVRYKWEHGSIKAPTGKDRPIQPVLKRASDKNAMLAFPTVNFGDENIHTEFSNRIDVPLTYWGEGRVKLSNKTDYYVDFEYKSNRKGRLTIHEYRLFIEKVDANGVTDPPTLSLTGYGSGGDTVFSTPLVISGNMDESGGRTGVNFSEFTTYLAGETEQSLGTSEELGFKLEIPQHVGGVTFHSGTIEAYTDGNEIGASSLANIQKWFTYSDAIREHNRPKLNGTQSAFLVGIPKGDYDSYQTFEEGINYGLVSAFQKTYEGMPVVDANDEPMYYMDTQNLADQDLPWRSNNETTVTSNVTKEDNTTVAPQKPFDVASSYDSNTAVNEERRQEVPRFVLVTNYADLRELGVGEGNDKWKQLTWDQHIYFLSIRNDNFLHPVYATYSPQEDKLVRTDDENYEDRRVRAYQSRVWNVRLPSAHVFAEEASGTEGSSSGLFVENYKVAQRNGLRGFEGNRFAQGASRKARIALPGYDDFHYFTPSIYTPSTRSVFNRDGYKQRVQVQDVYRTLGGQDNDLQSGKEMLHKVLPQNSNLYGKPMELLQSTQKPPMNVWYSYYPTQINNNVHMFVRTNFLSEHQESKYFQGPGRRTQNPEGTVATDILGVVPADSRFLQWDNLSGYAGPSSNGYFQTINMPEIREIQVKITDEKNRSLSEGLVDDEGEQSQNPEIMLGIRFDKIRNPDFSRAGRISDKAERSLHHPEAISLKGKPV